MLAIFLEKGLYWEAKGTEFKFKERKHYILRAPIRREIPVAARNECREERVVEASPQSFIEEYGGPDQKSTREGPLYRFSSGKPRRVFNSPEEPAHANSTFKGLSYLWHEPC
jgi:hypothetical protein